MTKLPPYLFANYKTIPLALHFLTFGNSLPPSTLLKPSDPETMASKAVAKATTAFQFPWRAKLDKYRTELTKGVWGYYEMGAWKPLGISARRRAMLRKEVLTNGEDWPYDPERRAMRTKRKGHKCDRISAEKRENTAKLMLKMPQMLLDYKKRRWEKKMKEEEKAKEDK